MTKNYFTDSQVKEVMDKVGMSEPWHITLERIKALMNLAVEAAIGEVELYMAKNLHNKSYATSRSAAEARLFLSQSGLKVDGVESEAVPLYSVKELES